MKILLKQYLFVICLLMGWQTNSFAAENAFYVLRYKTQDRMTPPSYTFESLKKNYKKIDILIPQAYHINDNGEVAGEIEPVLLDFANNHHMKIMPLVTNSQFSHDIARQFLADHNAQQKAVQALLALCKQYHFYGIQLDFEMVKVDERDALTKFFQYAADEMHKQGLVISFSVAPVVSDQQGLSHFLDKIYTNWEGAYDLQKLGEFADFVSIMAYNQHGGSTPPGPTASWEWTNQVIKHALQFMPPKKISLGVPVYSTYWYADTNTGDLSGKMMVKMAGINHEKALEIIKKYHASLQWDKKGKNLLRYFFQKLVVRISFC